MNTYNALKNMLKNLEEVHEHFHQTMEGVTNEVASFMPPGKAHPIAGLYAHLVFSEDFFAHFFLMKTKPLFETTWKDKTGISELQPTDWQVAYPKWLKEVKIDVPKATEYGKAVFAATEEYVASLKEEDLAKEVDMSMFGMGSRTAGDVLDNMIIGHVHEIMGEISVLKGIQGLKGYPY